MVNRRGVKTGITQLKENFGARHAWFFKTKLRVLEMLEVRTMRVGGENEKKKSKAKGGNLRPIKPKVGGGKKGQSMKRNDLSLTSRRWLEKTSGKEKHL